MYVSKRLLLAFLVALLTAGSLVFALGATADRGRGHDDDQAAQTRNDDRDSAKLFRSTLAPSMPTDPKIHGVAAGGAPWALQEGRVRLSRDGTLRLTVEGLVIPIAHGTFPAGTARPVTRISASLFCGADSTGPAATTGQVPISEAGDARLNATITLPSSCLAPIVLVHPNGITAAYIAVTGWKF